MRNKKILPGTKDDKLEWGKIVVPGMIGLISVLITAICGCVGTFIMTYKPSLQNFPPPVTSVLPTQATNLSQSNPVKDGPTVTVKETQLSSDLVDISCKYAGENIGVVPTHCWQVYMGESDSPSTIGYLEEVPLTLKFVVLSDMPVVIRDISLHLDTFTSPPDPSAIQEGLYVWGRGGGEVMTYSLAKVRIGAAFEKASLNDGTAYQLDANDAISFSTKIYLTEPGFYKYHLEVLVETYAGESFAYTVEPFHYAWLYMEDLANIRFTNSDFGDPEVTINPSCK